MSYGVPLVGMQCLHVLIFTLLLVVNVWHFLALSTERFSSTDLCKRGFRLALPFVSLENIPSNVPLELTLILVLPKQGPEMEFGE